jgi:hypothetical protein
MSAHVPDDSSTEPQATRIEQCPNCAIVLVRGDKGFYCVVCGFPRSARQPTRQPELADYIERLRRNESGADAKGLVGLAQKLGLRWGRPELAPDRSLKLNRFDGPVLAVQEATGSDKYLVVLCGEASWSTGLDQFFEVEGGKRPLPTRVRLGREAVAQIIGGESLQCLNPGELKVVARKPKPKRKSTPSPPTPSIAPPGGPKLQPADGRRTWPTPNPDRQEDAEKKKRTIQAFQNLLPPLTEVLAFLLILGILGAYLFWPWIKDVQRARVLEPSDEDYGLDCFILRDASKSPKTEAYDHAERQILDYLSVRYGDRISYAFFGADVLPKPIPIPSSDAGSIEDQRQVAGKNKQIYTTTDFAFLFGELRKTIEKDRQAQAATKRKGHVDVAIILSDGIPDLSPKKMGCPVPGQEFIPDGVITSFDALMKGPYATQERIYVRLVLIGGEFQRCTSDIQVEWERALGPKGLEVISYSKIGTGALGDELLKPLKRHSHIALKLHPLEDAQRRLLDQGERFSVAYNARSVGEGGELRVLSGTLVDDQQREMELNAFRNRTIKTTHPEHLPIIRVPSPDNGEALGKTIRSDGDFIYLEPDASEDSADFLSEQSTYALNLKVAVASHPNIQKLTPIVDPDPPTLRIEPCNQAEKKRLGRLRLQPLFLGSIVLSGIFLIGSLAWYTTKGASGETRLGRLNGALERAVVLPYKRWFEALIILLSLMTLGVFFLEEPLLLMICVMIIISSALFLLSSLRESQTAHMLVRLAEFMALPLIIEGAAHYLFK